MSGSRNTAEPRRCARDWSGANPLPYPDPDIVVLDERFQSCIVGNTPLQRLFTGALWGEGPVWNAVGRYLLWSDTPGNVQRRWLEDDARVSLFRSPANYPNASTFDHHGRLLSCENAGRRIVRREHDGSETVIATHYDGKHLNSPNDLVVHPDGGIWFSDPAYGIQSDYQGYKAEAELPVALYRVDASSGKVAKVSDALDTPNGLCFAPDYQTLYVTDTGEPSRIWCFTVQGNRLVAARQLASVDDPETGDQVAADGIRCDAEGRLWVAAGPYVQVFTTQGERIGYIRLPETCANLCFGGARRNRLFMAASQSLYAVYTGTSGAHHC